MKKNLFSKKIEGKFQASDRELLTKAYVLAKAKSAGADSVAFKAAELVLDHGADAATIAAALLAKPLWDGGAKLDEIRKDLGTRVAAILHGLKPSYFMRIGTGHQMRADIHGLLSAIAKTPHKALIPIAFRFIELEEAINANKLDSRPMAQETLEFYVPLANRLSLGGLRRRLEDVCFHILEPAEYDALTNRVAPIQAEDEICLKLLSKDVRRLLNKNGLHEEIKTRIKSLWGIRCKMIRTGKSLDEIMDRVGMRIVVASVPECYSVIGLLHTHFTPISGTFKDYIGLPKDNGYQSLHTCVYPVREISYKPIEFQVRTKLMHLEAEHGAAAHWLYKSETFPKKDSSQKQWMKRLLRQNKQAVSPDAFIETLHRLAYADYLVVFGNGGRIMRIPVTATVRDYLDEFNIRFGQGAVVRVNGNVAGMDRLLQDGDSIEIIKDGKLHPLKTAGGKFQAGTSRSDKEAHAHEFY